MSAVRNVTCPFCSLLCDDLSVRVGQKRLSVSDNACLLGKRGFSAPPPPSGARLKGSPAGMEQAIAAAAKILRRSRHPFIAGLGTDVNGIRAALQLAEMTGASLRHSQERAASHNLKTLQSRGGIMTTLAEVKNRADVIIFVGDNVTGDYPRFTERFINAPDALFLGKNRTRKLACLGRPGNRERRQFPQAPVAVFGRGDTIANNLALLRARLTNRSRPGHKNIPAVKNRKLDEIAAMIETAEYGVFVWSAAALPDDHADLIIDSLTGLIMDLNRKQRFAGLSLGGGNGGASFQSVATWQTGYPAGLNFAGGYPSIKLTPEEYPPGADSLVWISGFAADPPPALDLPTVVLSAHRVAADADVYIPIGAPGIDHGGNLFRTDSVINMPLKKVRDSGCSSAAEILGRIMARMERRHD